MALKEHLTADELQENFSLLVSWEDRYSYLLDLGKKLPAFDDRNRTDESRVHGCQSQVWLIPELNNEQPPRLDFIADSDSQIVRGLIGVLMVAYCGKTAQEILDLDIQSVFRDLGLDKHLSPTRANGLNAMVNRIQAFARESVTG